MDLDLGDDLEEDDNEEPTGEMGVYNGLIEFCEGPDLIEVFGESGSGKSRFSVEVLMDAVENEGKRGLFIDTEKNIGNEDDLGSCDYAYLPEWRDIYNYCIGQGEMVPNDAFGEKTHSGNEMPDGYDVVVVDSLGFPALVQYGKYRVADDAEQFKVFNEIQVITGELKKYAQMNDALVIVINQPKSDLSEEQDPAPFGDKSIFGFKEVWKTYKVNATETKTDCEIRAFRSRQLGKGSVIYRVEIDDSGADVTFIGGDDSDTWV